MSLQQRNTYDAGFEETFEVEDVHVDPCNRGRSR